MVTEVARGGREAARGGSVPLTCARAALTLALTPTLASAPLTCASAAISARRCSTKGTLGLGLG